MSRLPSLTPRQVTRAFSRAGWSRSEGSEHTLLSHPDHKAVLSVPRHRKSLGRGLVRRLIADSGMTRQEFVELL